MRILFCLCLLLPVLGLAQQSKVHKFYYQHAVSEEAKAVSVECKFGKQKSNADDKALSRVDFARLLFLDNEQINKAELKLLRQQASQDAYDTLVDVHSKGEELHLMVKEKANDRLEFLALARDEDRFFYLNLSGKFKVKDLLELDLGDPQNAEDLIEKIKKLDQCVEID